MWSLPYLSSLIEFYNFSMWYQWFESTILNNIYQVRSTLDCRPAQLSTLAPPWTYNLSPPWIHLWTIHVDHHSTPSAQSSTLVNVHLEVHHILHNHLDSSTLVYVLCRTPPFVLWVWLCHRLPLESNYRDDFLVYWFGKTCFLDLFSYILPFVLSVFGKLSLSCSYFGT